MALHCYYLGNKNQGNCLFSDSGNVGIRRDHPYRRIEMEFCVVGDLQKAVLRFEFHQNRSSGFRAVGSRNLPFIIDGAIG